MKYKFHIKNLSFDVEVEKLGELSSKLEEKLSTIIASELSTNPEIQNALEERDLGEKKYITLEEFNYDWEKAIQHTQNSDISIILLQDGKKYRVKEYVRQKLKKDLFIIAKNSAELVFGVDYYNQWDSDNSIKQDKYLFDLGLWNSSVAFLNVDLTSAVTVEEAQPFYRCLFLNSFDEGQIGNIAVVNSRTNFEFGLIYSGGDAEPLTIIQKDIHFKGVIWQEIKAKNGGGIQVIMDNCTLEQVDPPVYFKSKLRFSPFQVELAEGSFNKVETIFQGFGNSSNIVFLQGMTFLLPPKTFFKNYHNRYNQDSIQKANFDSYHLIHQIPRQGEEFLVSRSYRPNGEIIPDMLRNVINWEKLGLSPQKNRVREIQVGDRLLIEGQAYEIQVKDRVVGTDFAAEYRFNDENSYYSSEFKLDRSLPTSLGNLVQVKVLESKGEKLLDGAFREGFIIFKYNKHWQTNLEIDHGLDYMLASNPFGVLSYNHEEISIWANQTKHQGFYRQSASGKGVSKGYTLINCSGFEDQFAPKSPVASQGPMPKEATEFLNFLRTLFSFIP